MPHDNVLQRTTRKPSPLVILCEALGPTSCLAQPGALHLSCFWNKTRERLHLEFYLLLLCAVLVA